MIFPQLLSSQFSVSTMFVAYCSFHSLFKNTDSGHSQSRKSASYAFLVLLCILRNLKQQRSSMVTTLYHYRDCEHFWLWPESVFCSGRRMAFHIPSQLIISFFLTAMIIFIKINIYTFISTWKYVSFHMFSN